MKVKELEKKLIEISVPEDVYSILKGGLPNEKYCLTKDGIIGKCIIVKEETNRD